MSWIVYWGVAVAILASTVVGAIICGFRKYKSGRILDPLNILFVGVIASSVTLFIPIYEVTLKDTGCGWIETIFISIHNVIRLFVVDGDFEFVTANLSELSGWLLKGYTAVFAMLFVAAPLLTFGFVLSFFKNISAYRRYFTHFRSDVYIFSELNERSLSLAESLYQNRKKNKDEKKKKNRLFVFTDVFEKDEEQSYEFLEKAKELGAICFKKDIVTVNFAIHSKKSELNFFVIGNDQSENINQALKIIADKRYKENSNLYVFSTQVEAEILLAHAFNEGKGFGTKVRRVNEVQSLISRTLYDTGYENIFEAATPKDQDGIRHINALVVGMGEHGVEMTKALAWFCQMDGYRAEINSMDIDRRVKDKFVSLCPELMDDEHNGVEIDGESKYKINIHSAINVKTKEFDDLVTSISDITYVFVALGKDENNIATAIKLRMLLERHGCHPKIQAIVSNTDKKEALAGIKNFKGQEYDIQFIGDLKTSYSEEVILDPEVEKKALGRHTRWGDEQAFWQYDYNYKSSVASAIHYEMKKKCGIAGIEKKPADRTEEELWAIRKLEHCRWNAYMRSEGYVWGGTVEPTGRYDLAKKHHCLVPFDMLPLKEQEKDDD